MAASFPVPSQQEGYVALARELNAMRERSESEWGEAMRWYCRHDLYFLLRFVLSVGRDIKLSTGVPLFEHPFMFGHVKEVERDHVDVCDIGARGLGKSTEKTFGLAIQNILLDPSIAIGIFSVRINLAAAHLIRIKRELETNELLKALFSDILYADPGSSSRTEGSPTWANDALLVKRPGSRMEATVEISGFLDNMRTGRHYDIKIYDDCEDKETVTTEDQRSKAIEAWKLSLALRTSNCRDIYTGTYYHHASLYKHLEDSGIRIRKTPACRLDLLPPELSEADIAGYASRKNGKTVAVTYGQIGGYPCVETVARCVKDYVLMGPQHYGQQMQCDASAGSNSRLEVEKLAYYDEDPLFCKAGKVRYICVDPANSKKSGSDKTAYVVVGLGQDKNLYVLDLVKKRLDPSERIAEAFRLHRKWSPVREVRWEEVGLASDVHHLKQAQERDSYRFRVESIKATWKNSPDEAVMSFLEPLLSEGRLILPRTLYVENEFGERENLVESLIEEEMRLFPLGKENHWLHAFGLLHERKGVNALLWPRPDFVEDPREDRWRANFRKLRNRDAGRSWMSA